MGKVAAKNRKRKVAIVSQSMNIGGGEMMAARLAGYIDREKFDVKLFIIAQFKENQMAEELQKSGVAYECIGVSTSFSLKSYAKFAKALKAFSPDVIHVHLDVSYSWIYALLHRKPLVTTMHSDPFRWKDRRVTTMIRLKSKQGKLRVVGCSQKTAQLVKECYSLPQKQVTHIYNPIEVDRYYRSEERLSEFSFVHVGRFHPVKNHRLLLEAFGGVVKAYPMAHLYLAGDGELQQECQAFVAENGMSENVHFLGNVEDVPALLAKADTLVLSSRSEACPMVVLEAMAAGLSIVATKVGGVPELVSDNGFVVESENVAALQQAMEEMIANADQTAQMKEKSLQYSKRYDKSVIARQYEQEYLNLL